MNEMDCLDVVLENLDKYTTEELEEVVDLIDEELERRDVE